jgi:hypothetical protein
MKYYQQGDVLLKMVTELPAGMKKLEGEGSLVLQHGETTGHMHKFLPGSKIEVYANKEAPTLLSHGMTIVPGIGKFIVVHEISALRHEEHKPIDLLPGIYEMDLVREYDYSKDEVTRVVD